LIVRQYDFFTKVFAAKRKVIVRRTAVCFFEKLRSSCPSAVHWRPSFNVDATRHNTLKEELSDRHAPKAAFSLFSDLVFFDLFVSWKQVLFPSKSFPAPYF
jgi:hypothetical protein